MQDFAKLYCADDTGQVLATVESGDEGPELHISFKIRGMGRCTVKLGFPDTDEGWDLADKALRELTEEQALALAREQQQQSPFARLASTKREPEHACPGCGCKGWTADCDKCIPY